MPLFEVCVIHEATKKKEEKIVLFPDWVMAQDSEAAAFQFLIELTDEDRALIDSKRAKVLVRPF